MKNFRGSQNWYLLFVIFLVVSTLVTFPFLGTKLPEIIITLGFVLLGADWLLLRFSKSFQTWNFGGVLATGVVGFIVAIIGLALVGEGLFLLFLRFYIGHLPG